MMRDVRAALVVVLVGMLVGRADAADPREIARGRAIAEGAQLPDRLRCSRCHGVLGTGRPGEEAPRIAGQPAFYLEKQLEDFASGRRHSEKMEEVAQALDIPSRRAVAAYYSELRSIPYNPPPEGDPVLIQLGGALSAVGDPERRIRACELCHADAGVGIPPSFPWLAGQEADYTARQLFAWKRGLRSNDPLDVMAEIAKALDDREIEALALYFARVRPASADLSRPIPTDPIPPPPEPVPDPG